MKKIYLYPREKKLYALVDDADYKRLKKHRWYAMTRPNGQFMAYRGLLTEVAIRHRLLHREVIGEIPPGMVVDHKNHDPLDCRRSNLRVCTQQQNLWNRRANRKAGYSRYKYIYLAVRHRAGIPQIGPSPWYVRLIVNGKAHACGMFADEKDAFDASVKLMQELHGEFACIQPWQGYSDTPELRKILAYQNGPPNPKP